MKKAAPWIVILILIGGYFAWQAYQRPSPEQHPSMVSPPEVAPETTAREPEHPLPEVEPVARPIEPLPNLDESDGEVIGALTAVAGPEILDSVLVREQVIPRIVATVDSLDSRELAPLVMPVQSPQGKFQVAGENPPRIGGANYERYESYMILVASLPVDEVVEIYRHYYPLFQQAYEELGHADGYFNDRLFEIIDHLMETPVLDHSPALVKSESVYQFEDEKLEALSAGQKMLLRIGPDNGRQIRDKLAALRIALAGEMP